MGPFSRQLARIGVGAGAGLYQAGNRIKTRSQELVPVDTGTLKASARVLEPEITGDGVTVVVGYGYGDEYGEKASGDGVGYAIYVHEDTTAHHEHGQAHFLSEAALEEIPALGGDVAVSIRKPMIGGVDVVEEVLA